MSTSKKVEALLADFLPRIREIEDEALARVREVEADAREKIARHEKASAEMEQVEERIEFLGEELERLPAEVVKADMEEARALEDGLRARYRGAKSELEAAEARRVELRRELAELLPGKAPRHEPHPLDARITHTASVAGVAFEERKVLDDLRDRLTKAADKAAGDVRKEHERHHGQVRAWSNTVEWQRSPAGRGAIRA